MRKDKRTWITSQEANSSSWMKIWNAKSGDNMYSDFEAKFGALLEVHFRQVIYRFEALEVRNLTLQTVCKSELEQRSYDCLKIIVQSWRNILKWFRNSTYEFEIQFEMTPISNSHTTTLIFRLLYFGDCILGTSSTLSGPYTTRNHDFTIFLVILGNYL